VKSRRPSVWTAVQQVASAVLVSFLLLPVAALVLTLSWDDFLGGLRHPLLLPALRLSLLTTCTSLGLVVVLGSLLAWNIARQPGRVSRWVEAVTQLPAVIPPAVAGVGLLLAFGRRGLLGGFLAAHGMAPAFTTSAVVMAEAFVSAPFFVQAAIAAFRRVDENLLVVARTLGASPFRAFFRVGLPLAAPGLVAGAAMSWARSLGEFGATLLFAGNLTGRTQTLPLAVYTAMESDLRAAQVLSLVMVAGAFTLLFVLRRMAPGGALPVPGARGA
jgi:molybdate transport system permease protein